jgi:hypothetical protein
MRTRFVLVADPSEALLAILRNELADTDYALLRAETVREAIGFLDLLQSEIDLVIIELRPTVGKGVDGDCPVLPQTQPVTHQIIATTPAAIPPLQHVAKALGVDAVVHIPKSVKDWRTTIEVALSGGFREARFVAAEGVG